MALVLSVPFRSYLNWSAFVVTASFASCLVYSLYYNFDGVTRTHCRVSRSTYWALCEQVKNWIPSISAVIGDYTPQRYIWRIGIAWMSWLRMFEAVLLFKFFEWQVGNPTRAHKVLNALTSLTHVGENLCLLGLTYVSSTENYGCNCDDITCNDRCS